MHDTPRTRPRAMILPQVFYPVAGVVLLLVAAAFAAPSRTSAVAEGAKRWVAEEAGWFTVLSVAGFLVFVVGVAASRIGTLKLGPDHSEPDYGYPTWFAMLFAAGMGIGLMYFGVAEPVMHFSAPPVGEAGSVDAARQAMRITLFHWGLHAWAVYAVVALSLAYFAYRHGLPLRLRSALYPLIGERIHGWIGHAVDAFAALGTIFGLATSLGLGVIQINSGLDELFGVGVGTGMQVALIAGITLVASASVFSGLDRGVRRLSEFNMLLAVALLLFVLLAGPTIHVMQALVQNTGMYLSNVFAMTFNLYAYEPTGWIGGWTLFYWGWWIAWSPFVGMFIARISRGRTIREFVVGVLLVPMGFTCLWMTTYGNSALHMILFGGDAGLVEAVAADSSVALYRFLHALPLATVTSVVATLLVAVFFVTSADSGALVRPALLEGRGGVACVAADLLVAARRCDRDGAAGRGRTHRAAGGNHRCGAAVHGDHDPGVHRHAARDAAGRRQARSRARCAGHAAGSGCPRGLARPPAHAGAAARLRGGAGVRAGHGTAGTRRGGRRVAGAGYPRRGEGPGRRQCVAARGAR